MPPKSYTPPFSITPDIINAVADISEAVGRIAAFDALEQHTPQVTPQVTLQVADLLKAMQGQGAAVFDREVLQTLLGLSDRKSFRERYLKPANGHLLNPLGLLPASRAAH